MAGDWLWGELPSGFKKLGASGRRMIAVRDGLEEYRSFERLPAERSAEIEEIRFHGRGRLTALRLDDGTIALVRSYRHGGMLRHLTRGFFFTWPARPFRELAVTEEARRRGVPTVEILAACVERICGPFYRGWLVTRELEGARDLWAAVQPNRLAARSKEALLEAAARAVRLMHRRGVYHRDLNLKNIVVRREPEGLKGYLIDFDKSRLFAGDLPASRAEKNLARLRRSIRRLDPDGRCLSEADWKLFLRFYREAGAA